MALSITIAASGANVVYNKVVEGSVTFQTTVEDGSNKVVTGQDEVRKALMDTDLQAAVTGGTATVTDDAGTTLLVSQMALVHDGCTFVATNTGVLCFLDIQGGGVESTSMSAL